MADHLVAPCTPPGTWQVTSRTERSWTPIKSKATAHSLPMHGEHSKSSLGQSLRAARKKKKFHARQRDAVVLQDLNAEVAHLRCQCQELESTLAQKQMKMKGMITMDEAVRQFQSIKEEFVTKQDIDRVSSSYEQTIKALQNEIVNLKNDLASRPLVSHGNLPDNSISEQLLRYRSELAQWMDQCIDRYKAPMMKLANLEDENHGILLGSHPTPGVRVRKLDHSVDWSLADRNIYTVCTAQGQVLKIPGRQVEWAPPIPIRGIDYFGIHN